MSDNLDDKLIVEIDLDESSVDKSLDDIGQKANKAFTDKAAKVLNAQIINLSKSIDTLSNDVANLGNTSEITGMGLSSLGKSVSLTDTEVRNLSIGIQSLLISVDSFVDRINNMKTTIEELPQRVNQFLDSLQFLIKGMIDLIKFTSLGENELLKKLVPALEQVNEKITENRENISQSIERYKAWVSLKESIGSFFSALWSGIKIATAGFVGFLAVFGVAQFRQGQSVLLAYMTLFNNMGQSLKGVISSVKAFAASLSGGFLNAFNSLKNAVSIFKKDFATINDYFSQGHRGLFHFADAMILLTAKLGAATAETVYITQETEGFADILSGITIKALGFATAIAGAVTLAIVLLIEKVADLAFHVGTKLVESFTKSYEQFILFRKETLQFEETIKAFSKETQGASGSVESWNESIMELNKTLNFGIGELRKSGAEIVAIGSRLGLTEEQMKSLMKVTAEYATIAHRDLFETTIAFGTALQGQSQAVQSYGVKLTEASNAAFAFKHGMTKSYEKMTEHEKQQLRFNNLMSQYATVQGIATTISNDWFNQTKKLSATQDRLNNQVGLGAAYIEDLNFGASLLNNILSKVSDSAARFYGFMGALTGRLLQLIGLTIEWGFKIFLVYRSLQLLNILLSSNTWVAFASKTLPIINLSLQALADKAINGKANLVGLANIMKTLAEVFNNNKAKIFAWVTGLGAAGLGVNSLWSIISTRLIGALVFLKAAIAGALGPIIPYLPYIAIAAGAIYGLFKAFAALEEKTKFFSTVWEAIKDGFSSFFDLFSGEGGIFTAFGKDFGMIMGQISGLFVRAIGSIMNTVAVFIASNPMGIFSEKTVANFKKVSESINNFKNELALANGNLFGIASSMNQASSAVQKGKFDFEKFADVVNSLNDATKNQTKDIKTTYGERLKIITEALQNEAITQSRYSELIALAKMDKLKKTNDLIKNEFGDAGKDITQIEMETYNRRINMINEMLKLDLINQQQYLDFKKKAIDDYEKHLNDAAKGEISTAEKVAQAFRISVKQAEKAMEITASISQATNAIVTDAFTRLGASLVEGSNAWDDFGSFILDTIGTLAIQVGSLIMGIGIAVNAMTVSLSTFQGWGAIAAGAALITLGGALKALSKKGSSTGQAPTSAAGNAIAPIGVTPSTPQPRPDNQRKEPDRNVVINIEGSLFSTEQTSRTLISMISKEFDKTGADIRRRSFA